MFIQVWMKAGGHTFKNFETKLIDNLNNLQWMCSADICKPTEMQSFHEIYCYLKSSNIDINIFLKNYDINIYEYAKDFYLKYNKKKVSKK